MWWRRLGWIGLFVLAGTGIGVACATGDTGETGDPTSGGSTPAGGAGGSGGTGGAGGAYAQAHTAEHSQGDFDSLPAPFPARGAGPVTVSADFVWRSVVGRASPFELSVEFSGARNPLVQIFTINDRPFVRAGEKATQLEENVSYRIEVTRTNVAIWSQVVRTDDDYVILGGPAASIEAASNGTLWFVSPRGERRVRLEALQR